MQFRKDLQVCKICMRGHSPDFNLIVFCDGCNDPYHQLCHNPPIGRMFIEIPDAQWFCSECQKAIQHVPVKTGMSGESLSDSEVCVIDLKSR